MMITQLAQFDITKKRVSETEMLLKGIRDRQLCLNRLSQYLSELESQLSLIFSASPDIIIFLDEHERIVKISDAAFTILGYSKDEMLERPVWDFILKQDVEKTREHFNVLIDKKMVYFDKEENYFVNRWISKAGEVVKLMWRFSLCDERQKYTIGVATNISQLKRADFFNLKLLQKTIDASKDGIIIIDTQSDCSIIYANKSYEEIVGLDLNDILGQHFLFTQTDDNKESRAVKTLSQCIADGKGCDVLLEMKKSNGEIFYSRLAISAVTERGVITNFIGVVRDITEKIGIKYEWSPNAESGFIHLSKLL
jgi:PAS domain S-box-containing protein